jgi:hypothetical protein
MKLLGICSHDVESNHRLASPSPVLEKNISRRLLALDHNIETYLAVPSHASLEKKAS